MTTLDDKLLGEKLQNYCSSSSEEEDNNNDEDNERRASKTARGPKFIAESELREQEKAGGFRRAAAGAENTGPKGVIKDWQRFKQLENQKNASAQQERAKLAKRLALTCRSDDLDKELERDAELKKEAAKASSNNNNIKNDLENDDLIEDEFFQEYLKKRIEEMQKKTLALPRFGKVIELTNEMFLSEIDNENKNVTIFIHIYDQKKAECRLMNECLDELAAQYSIVKMCRVKSTEINMSDKFRKMGCPALLIYKNTELIGNFVKMSDEFGDEFCASDVENFLIEQGFLPSGDILTKIRQTNNENEDD